MVTRDTAWPAGTPCWIDLGVDDIGRASTFYTNLFGWDIQAGAARAGGRLRHGPEGRPAGGGHRPEAGTARHACRSGWTYLATDDLDDTVSKIKAAGYQTLAGPMDVMDVGRMAVAADPGGAFFGVWQARAHTGVGLANEPGSLCWNENISRAYDQNQAFYQAVFGYEYGDLSGDGYRYATLKVQRYRGRRDRRIRQQHAPLTSLRTGSPTSGPPTPTRPREPRARRAAA